MREIVFDTETTGLSFAGGDRMVEIGCVELVNRVETGRTFHAYFHPERDMPAEARARPRPVDAVPVATSRCSPTRVDELLEFIGDAPLVAHNAGFDFGFLNGELGRCGRTAGLHDADGRHAGDRAQRHPGAKHIARRAVLALRHRPLATASCTARCSTRSCSRRSMSS